MCEIISHFLIIIKEFDIEHERRKEREITINEMERLQGTPVLTRVERKSNLSKLVKLRRKKWQPTPVFLPGESQGWGSLVGCRLWGRTESDTTEVT